MESAEVLVVRRVELVSALLASVIGLTWVALLVHLMRLLTEASSLLGMGSLLVTPPMGWTMFWLYCTAMVIADVGVALGAYLHLRDMRILGRSMLWVSAAVLVVGVAFYYVAPDQFIPYAALSNYHDSVTWISVPGAFLAGIAAVAAVTPLTVRTGSRPGRAGNREQSMPADPRPS